MKWTYKPGVPMRATASDLARRLPTMWAYVDHIGSRYCVMVWRGSPEHIGVGQYEILQGKGYETEQEAQTALQTFVATIKARA
jgi:hypothetical protein